MELLPLLLAGPSLFTRWTQFWRLELWIFHLRHAIWSVVKELCSLCCMYLVPMNVKLLMIILWPHMWCRGCDNVWHGETPHMVLLSQRKIWQPNKIDNQTLLLCKNLEQGRLAENWYGSLKLQDKNSYQQYNVNMMTTRLTLTNLYAPTRQTLYYAPKAPDSQTTTTPSTPQTPNTSRQPYTPTWQ